MVRIAIVSMLVRDALPDEIPFTVRARPWTGEAPPADDPSDSSEPVLVFSVYRDEFIQEGPCGPIEAKRILLLRAPPNQRTRVTFDLEPKVQEALGFCASPPLLLEHKAPPGGGGNGGAAPAGDDPLVMVL